MASTDVDTTTSKEVDIPDIDGLDGLEDVEDTDLAIPRITINHKEGFFVDSQTSEEFTEFEGVILGLVKQRVLWPPQPEGDGAQPMCRANNFKVGHPDPAKWVQKHDGEKAVDVSGFTFDEVESGELNCANCGLKEWGAMPGNSTPWCNEVYTFPLIRFMDDGSTAPALISFQRTGLKPCKSYVSGFVQTRKPLYTAITRVSAVHNRKGSVDFVTPAFQKVNASDPTEWEQYSESLHGIRDFITAHRSFDDDASEKVTENKNTPPPKAAKKAETEPEYGDDEPF